MSSFGPSFTLLRSLSFCVGLIFHGFSFFCFTSVERASITRQFGSLDNSISYSF